MKFDKHARIWTQEISICALRRTPLIGPAAEVAHSVRQRYDAIQTEDRLSAVEHEFSSFQTQMHDLVQRAVSDAMDAFQQPTLDGPTLTRLVKEFKSINEAGYNTALFEGLFLGTSHHDSLKRVPQNYGSVLEPDAALEPGHFPILIELDGQDRVLAVPPASLSRLLSEASGQGESHIIAPDDVFAIHNWAMESMPYKEIIDIDYARQPIQTEDIPSRTILSGGLSNGTRVIVVASGKGGVGTTTTSASIATGLASRGYKTVVIEFDVGTSSLDQIMGCEKRIVYDLGNLVNQEASLHQTLIKYRKVENLYILPASKTLDSNALSIEGLARVMYALKQSEFDYIICNSPAGIEWGAKKALYFADEAIILTRPDVTSIRASDRIIGIMGSESKRAKMNEEPVKLHMLITRYNPGSVADGRMLSVDDIVEQLSIPLLGIIPESPSVLESSNAGEPVILNQLSEAGAAYSDAIDRLLGYSQDS